MKKIDVYFVQKVINVLDKYVRARRKNEPSQWDALFIGKDKYVHQLSEGLKMNLYKDSVISELIFEGFEKNEELFIQNLLKPGDTFIDIGANAGLHSLVAAKALNGKGKVYAFEPTPKTIKRLTENVELNNLSEHISVQPVGLSNQNGELKLNLADNGYDAWNSFVNLTHIAVSNHVNVPVITFDSFVQDNNIDISEISLVKIDVEGWEINVLEGMKKTLANDNFNSSFLIEFTEENMFRAGYSCKELYNYLLNRGYKWFEYDAASNQLKPSELKAYYPYENLIATKNPEPVNACLKQGS
ncbi:MAG: FkbM family methyltransferase [Mucilaginibacter sp.]|nr:FkbM family methyltransferase [Mucilaginibacter sp.]